MVKVELDKQKEYIKKIRELNDAYYKETGKRRKYFTLTMGCQMNSHDSEKLSGMLNEMGYAETHEEENADFVIYNTCCVRENAELKVYGKLGRLKHYKEKNPDLKIAVCGCMMQQDGVLETIKNKYRQVDIVFGTFNTYKLPELISANIEGGSAVFDVWKEQKEIIEDLPSIREYKYKAGVNIMYGCNNFCSYCIVPYVRGRERSREASDIIREIKALAADGVKEIMLLGQNVNSYGKTLESKTTFAELLRSINNIAGIERIKFMTSHPKDLSRELILAMKDCEKVCNYLHLPVQSGSDIILKKMNRHYTKADYLKLIDDIKREMPDIMISTDIIVGFPGETEKDFEETLDVVRKVGYSTAFTFIYSKRTGTPAAAMENQVDEAVIKDRFARLLNVLNPLVHSINERQLGKTLDVLVEEKSRNGEGLMTGRAFNNSLVHFAGGENLIGQIVKVRITDNKTFYLIGERIG